MALKTKLICKYGKDCYRKNIDHLSVYSHEEIDCNQVGTNQSEEPLSKKSKAATFFTSTNKHINKENQSKAHPCTPDDRHFVEEVMQMKMPNDFFSFWDYCVSVDEFNPLDALNIANIKLVGAFRLLIPNFDGCNDLETLKKNFLVMDRHFFDPPQFTPLMASTKDCKLHFGYYRDDPTDLPIMVTSNDSEVDGKHVCRGSNIFTAVRNYLEKQCKQTQAIGKLISNFDLKFSSFIIKITPEMKKRNKSVVAIPLSGIGLVVKMEPKSNIGYRELPETNGRIQQIIANIEKASDCNPEDLTRVDKCFDPLMEMVTLTQFANDELDYGMGLELGLDLFSGSRNSCFTKLIANLLPMAFDLLNQPLFEEIVSAHLAVRY